MTNVPAASGGQPVEQVDAVDADPGGVPFDDEIEGEVAPDDVDRGGGGYDSASYLNQNKIGYPASAPAGMLELRRYVTARWGGTDLGILARPPRPVRGGTSASLHNWGMAWDWRWSSPGPGRPVADEVIKFCLDHAQVLGIQAVHDYQSCRYWKSYAGWKQATSNPSTGFGQPWAQWLHIERMWADANRADHIDSLVGQAATPAAAPAAAASSSGDGYALPTGPSSSAASVPTSGACRTSSASSSSGTSPGATGPSDPAPMQPSARRSRR